MPLCTYFRQSNLSCEEVVGDPALSNDNPTFSATVGSVEVDPHKCNHCHKQYASNAKLLQHMRSKHPAAIQQLEGAAAGEDQNDSGQIQYHQAVDAENNQIHQQVNKYFLRLKKVGTLHHHLR